MKKIIILITVFLSLSAYGQIDSSKIAELNKLGLYQFPILSDLKQISFDEGWIAGSSVQVNDINNEFDNIEDLVWLKPIARDGLVLK
ncbi:MAG: hypothetical protein JEY96_18985 [Bacteroidales bacterium]|nr:hypothetical protein [Bacteroidales bacterium]